MAKNPGELFTKREVKLSQRMYNEGYKAAKTEDLYIIKLARQTLLKVTGRDMKQFKTFNGILDIFAGEVRNA